MRHTLAIAAFAIVSACCTPGSAMPDSDTPPNEADVCGFIVKDVSAWKNRMPGPDGANGNLIVMIEVEDDGVSRRFESRGIDETGTLKLDVVAWGPDAGLGKIVLRDKGLSPKRIEISCGGEQVTTIEEVMDVY